MRDPSHLRYSCFPVTDPTAIKPLRRRPKQARSRALVEAVLESAARVLVKEGLAGFTTNRVAEVAGVSVGSLYQYFPDKTALLAALFDRHRRDIVAILDEALVGGGSLEEDLLGLIEAAIAAHAHDPSLHHALSTQLAAMAGYIDIDAVRREISARLEAFFETHSAKIAPRTASQAAFLAERTIEGVVHGAVIERPEALTPDLAKDLAAMLARHLAGPPASENG